MVLQELAKEIQRQDLYSQRIPVSQQPKQIVVHPAAAFHSTQYIPYDFFLTSSFFERVNNNCLLCVGYSAIGREGKVRPSIPITIICHRQ